MDPNAAWKIIMDLKSDFEDVQEAARNLKAWMDRGGFAPRGWENDRPRMFAMLDKLISARPLVRS